MQFKVGDRVEAIKPPVGVEDSQADQVGPGVLVSIDPGGWDGETHKVQLDSGEEWWYSEDRLRHAVQEIEIHPTPSITVGTQVRLTGVVEEVSTAGEMEVRLNGGEWATFLTAAEAAEVEVIRQPFKRGAVVYAIGHETRPDNAWVIVADEKEGKALAVVGELGWKVVEFEATYYERRP